jgi:hypothetical protein
MLNVALPVIASAIGYKSAKSQNKANRQMAAEQMAFQERMSNTAFQRQREDMLKSGLNPILAARAGGASTPGGASARMEDKGAAARRAALESASVQQVRALTYKAEQEGQIAAHNTVLAAANAVAAQQVNQLRTMDIEALKKLGLSPMQLQYAPWNQLGSMAIDKSADVGNAIDKAGKWLGNTASDIRRSMEADIKKWKNKK